MMETADGKARCVICLSNEGYTAALEVRKLYRAVADENAESLGMIRVVDESGEDYLYPASMFAAVDLPAAVENALAASG